MTESYTPLSRHPTLLTSRKSIIQLARKSQETTPPESVKVVDESVQHLSDESVKNPPDTDVDFLEISDADMVLTTTDYWHIVGAFILPGALAMSPVLMPFGNPFAKDGDNSIATNWAYYFWYTPIGWCAMWIKIVLWNSELWNVTFFFPFMHSRPGAFQCNSTLIAVLNSTVFATMFYCFGYMVFRNPVPIGTIAFGVPCFVVLFINMYFFVVPRENRASFRDHFRILRCWIPFVIWFMALCVFMGLVWLQTYIVMGIESKVFFVLGNVGVQFAFIAIRETLGAVPLEWFMGDQHLDLSMLWNLGYAAMCSTMTDWIFPGMPTDVAGLTSTALVILLNVVLSFVQFLLAKDLESLTGAFLNNMCDVISGWAFLFIFIYNAFGPNHRVIFMISEMSTKAKVEACVMIGVSVLVNAIKLLAMVKMAPRQFDPALLRQARAFGLMGLRSWYWLVTWLLVSTCCACGACMVMMHDGMDFSFRFKQWDGTWPFVN
jgi:hypothetical protein